MLVIQNKYSNYFIAHLPNIYINFLLNIADNSHHNEIILIEPSFNMDFGRGALGLGLRDQQLRIGAV